MPSAPHAIPAGRRLAAARSAILMRPANGFMQLFLDCSKRSPDAKTSECGYNPPTPRSAVRGCVMSPGGGTPDPRRRQRRRQCGPRSPLQADQVIQGLDEPQDGLEPGGVPASYHHLNADACSPTRSGCGSPGQRPCRCSRQNGTARHTRASRVRSPVRACRP